jgi:HSP20 family protein
MTRTLIRFDPWQQLARMEQQMDELLGKSTFLRRLPEKDLFVPTVDSYTTEDEIVYKLDLPGLEATDITIELEDQLLHVSGERSTESEEKQDDWITRERRYGSFRRSFAVPAGLDEDDIDAEFGKGVLTIKLPRPAESKPKQIDIKLSES